MAGQAVDARVLRDAMSRYLQALRSHRQEIDSLNVFPVPDGDTGTNMLLTQEAVARALAEVEDADLDTLGQVISRAALMGARGNSGVILSQFLRALCERLGRGSSAGAEDLAEALALAAEGARRAVAQPVDGTMLSVMDDAAEGARRAATNGGEPADVAAAALRAASESLERTRALLPALAEAGVVDAGAKGAVLLLDAFQSALHDVPLSVEVGPLGPVGEAVAPRTVPSGPYGFEVMYLLECDDAGVASLRDRLQALGDSLVVVGGDGLYSIHLHTDHPDRAVEEANPPGRPRDVRITSLDQQVAPTCVAGEARAVRVEAPAPPAQSLVAVVEGEGLARLFESVGATAIRVGSYSQVSVHDLVDAATRTPGETVHLVPNDEEGMQAARAVAARSGKRIEVVAAGTVPQGLAAALAFDPEASPENNLRAMGAAADRCAAGAVSMAGSAEPETGGRWLGRRGEEVTVTGPDAAGVVAELVTEHLGAEGRELVTLYLGKGVSDEEGRRVVEAVAAAAPDLEIEVHRGDQSGDRFLVGVE
jgi:uncharacterized protein